MAKSSKKARAVKRDRTERRFEPRSTANPTVVQAIGALGAIALGAGFYGQFMRPASDVVPPLAFAPWVLAAGAVLLGIAIWLGTSGDPALRVGDAGVGIEKSGLRHIPWHALESIVFDRARQAVTVRGTDDTKAALVIVASVKSQPQAAAWIVKEARARVANIVDFADDGDLPAAQADAGEIVALEALQVVGKRCAESDKVIAYEPDARVCPQCERVYHRSHVPAACACGASLASLQAKKAAPSADVPPASDAPSEDAAGA